MTTAAERTLKKHVAAARAGDTQAVAEVHAILAAALRANSTTPYMRRVLAEMYGATGKKLKVDGRTYNSTEAEVQAVALSLTKTFLRPKAVRDDKRQAGTRKKRQRWPEVNDWIDAQLRRDPNVKSPELLRLRPDYIRDPHGYEPISKRTFEARVTERRKLTRK